MRCIDRSFASPADNLRLDDHLLEECETTRVPTLRFWESPSYFVVLGRSSQPEREVHLAACQERQIPVLKRSSGGGTVLQGPGCLNYALTLPIEIAEPLNDITRTYVYVLERHRLALENALQRPVGRNGICDLTLDDRKFSGNAQRRKRDTVLIHGTFLYDINPALMEAVLPPPTRQPAYRANRPHSAFLTTVSLSPEALRKLLSTVWQPTKSTPACRLRE